MFSIDMKIAGFDDELSDALKKEIIRQEEHIELIASENYASPRVLEAQGSLMTNKYAEGYPARRYYGGCENVDVAEQLAIDRLKDLYALIMQMFSRIQGRKLMQLFTLLY